MARNPMSRISSALERLTEVPKTGASFTTLGREGPSTRQLWDAVSRTPSTSCIFWSLVSALIFMTRSSPSGSPQGADDSRFEEGRGALNHKLKIMLMVNMCESSELFVDRERQKDFGHDFAAIELLHYCTNDNKRKHLFFFSRARERSKSPPLQVYKFARLWGVGNLGQRSQIQPKSQSQVLFGSTLESAHFFFAANA